MGLGIARQIGNTPGMVLSFVSDLSMPAAEQAARISGQKIAMAKPIGKIGANSAECLVSTDPMSILQEPSVTFDVLVEATNAIGEAGRYCRAAIQRSAHVVLMNAEVDLALGLLMQREAQQNNVVVTSDGGDQHGVLKRMIDELSLWGFRIVQAGNIKGFLHRYATAESLVEEAAKRHLNPVQCCAYTDGTKLNIEMALIGNGLGLLPSTPGMEGPACKDVHEVMKRFDFTSYDQQGRVDYILGAEPSGGVYVVAYCDDPLQMQYLDYYKMGEGPYYLFYRPYHLCHLETPRVIAESVLDQKTLLQPEFGQINEVFAYAKRSIRSGTLIEHGIGGNLFYGLIDKNEHKDQVPIVLLEPEEKHQARVIRDVEIDQPICWADIDLPDSYLVESWRQQNRPTGSPYAD